MKGAASADTAEVDRISVQNLIILENYLQQEIRVVQSSPFASNQEAEENRHIDPNKVNE